MMRTASLALDSHVPEARRRCSAISLFRSTSGGAVVGATWGALTLPRALLRGLGMSALHAVPSMRAPGRARRALVGARTNKIACGASGRDHGAKRNAVV
jgi:hypothetical protein